MPMLRYYQTNDGWARWIDWYACIISRAVFVLAWFLMVLPALCGRGRFMRWVFGSPFMVVYGRLTFGIYLVHWPIMDYNNYNK